MVDDSVIKIFASEMRVSRSGENFEYAVLDGEEGYVEGAATKVVYNDFRLSRRLIQSVSNGSGRWLVYNT